MSRGIKGQDPHNEPDLYDETLTEFDKILLSDEFKAASTEIGDFVTTLSTTTVAEIAREFPQHERLLFTLLDYLRIEGQVHWDEWRPLPTLIHVGDRRISEEAYKYNWNTARDRTWHHRQASAH